MKLRSFRMLLLVSFGFGSVWLADAPAAEVAEQFKCAVCHTDLLNEYRRRRATALVPHDPRPVISTGQQVETSTPDMCFSCHDGFVLDSRALWKEGHKGHRVGMPPSAGMNLPGVNNVPVFPMNDDGKMYCGSCHSAHQNSDAAIEAAPFMRVSPNDGQLCQACHDEKLSIVDSAHHSRASQRRRNAPKDFEPRGMCTICHVAHEAKGPVLWFEAPGEGNTPVNTLCTSCHIGSVYPSEHPSDIVAWSQDLRHGYSDNSGGSMPVFDNAGLQAENGSIGCPTCHNAHKENAEGLSPDRSGKFLRLSDTRDFLCADCHAQTSLQRYLYFHTD
jgi:predicted CXXCH cytochrome family protein